jgi:hypothetical protein
MAQLGKDNKEFHFHLDDNRSPYLAAVRHIKH